MDKEGENNQSEPKEKKKARKSRKIALRPSLQIIAPISDIEHRAQLQSTIQTGYLTHSEAISRIDRIRKKEDRKSNWDEDLERTFDLVVAKESVALMHGQDALEEVRIALSLDKERERLTNDLLRRISVTDGIKLFNEEARRLIGKEFGSIRDINSVFPEITAFEIAMLPFVEQVPQSLFLYGNDLPIVPNEKKEETKKRKELAPSLVGATPDGLVFSDSNFDFKADEARIQTDSYLYMGITGKREDAEIVPYTAEVMQDLDRLIPLVFTNNRLHERIWEEVRGSALSIGFGRIAEQAYIRCFGKTPQREDSKMGWEYYFSKLNREERMRFEKEKEKMETSVYKGNIIDLGRDTIMEKDEMFTLVGMLERIPDSFCSEEGFRGYIQPYGVGIKIIDENGSQCEYVKYNPFFARQSVYNIYWETVDSSKTNVTLRDIMGDIFQQAEAKVVSEGIDNEENLSLLEGMKTDIKLQHDINLEIRPKTSIVETRKAFHGDITPSGFSETTNSKFTITEARDVQNTLKLLPKDLLRNIKKIRKQLESKVPLETFLTGMRKEGEYLPYSKEVVLYITDTEENLPDEFKDVRRLQKIFTLLHEIGESVWSGLDEEGKEEWKNISWKEENKEPNDSEFLTYYSKSKDERDDFCDHFACYVLHGQEFRDKAAKNNKLRQKYHTMKKRFIDGSGNVREYPQIAPFTIEQVHGSLDQAVQQMSVAEAVHRQEQEAKRRFEQARKHISTMVISFEEIKEKALEQEETDDDIKQPHEKQIPISTAGIPEETLIEDQIRDDAVFILGLFMREDQSAELAQSIRGYFDQSELENISNALSGYLNEEDLADAMDQFKELRAVYDDVNPSSITGFTGDESDDEYDDAYYDDDEDVDIDE